MSGDGVQAADLKRMGQASPKLYVHKDGKTILIPAEKKDEYMAKGYKLSSLRAEDKLPEYDGPDETKPEPSDMNMNKYGLSAKNLKGKFYSYRHGKLTGTFDNMTDLQKHQHDLIKDESVKVEKQEKNCGCGQTPCITYGKQNEEESKEIPANVKKIAKELDKAVAMHKSQAKRLRKAGVSEDLAQMAHKVEQDHEVQMARSDLYKAAKYSIKLHDRLKNVSEEQGLEGWVAAKITKASDYLSSVFHYMDYEMMSSEEMTESRTKIVQAIKAKSEQPAPTYKETISKKYQSKLEEMSKKKTEPVLEDFIGKPISEEEFEKLAEKKDACYHKVRSRYKVWPSAYASGALVQCRKKGAANWGNKSKK